MWFIELQEDVFWKWFVENQPLRGKVKSMEKICEAFPESCFSTRQTWPPYKASKYSNEAAKLINKWKDEGKIIAEKSGRTWIWKLV